LILQQKEYVPAHRNSVRLDESLDEMNPEQFLQQRAEGNMIAQQKTLTG
jgi:hypothetical protein